MAKRLQPVSQQKNTQSGAIYKLIRDDIIQGRLAANSRLKISALAEFYGTSTNPIREALQQLRGEGFVLIEPNRGARVRPIDDDFIRDVYEIESLIEPYLAKSFVELATSNDIIKLEELHEEIAELNFLDPVIFTELDTRFHSMFYRKHYNHTRSNYGECIGKFLVPFPDMCPSLNGGARQLSQNTPNWLKVSSVTMSRAPPKLLAYMFEVPENI